MRVAQDKITGPYRLIEDLRLYGMIVGGATVPVFPISAYWTKLSF